MKESPVCNFILFANAPLDPQLVCQNIQADRIFAISHKQSALVYIRAVRKYRPSRVVRCLEGCNIERVVSDSLMGRDEFYRLKKLVCDAVTNKQPEVLQAWDRSKELKGRKRSAEQEIRELKAGNRALKKENEELRRRLGR